MNQRLVLAVFLALMLIVTGGGATQAQDKTLFWERYDVNLAVQENSDILVEEIQQIVFTSGTFRFGFAAIPLGRVERITDLSVAEIVNGQERVYTPNSSGDYGFEAGYNKGNLEISWYFPPTSNSDHTYILRYRVIGGLRLYEEGDQLWWKAVPADHNFPIRQSTVTVTLPRAFPQNQLLAENYGVEAAISYEQEQGRVVFDAANIPPNRELEVRVQFPHGVVQGSTPAWQAADDRVRSWGPVLGIVFGGLGLILLVGGPLAVYSLWYTRGRDRPVGLAAEYVAEPPSDLPAAVVGTLIDEQAEMKDIIAAIPDLARRGVLRMEEENKPGFLGIGSGRDYIFYLEDAGKATRPFEKRLVQRIFGKGQVRRMSDLRQKFYTAIPELKKELYQEVVNAGFFPNSPDSTRQRWSCLGIAGLVGSGLLAFLLLGALGEYTALAACPGAALALTMILLIFFGQHMPRKTAQGAEEAAKWEAFKRYLERIDKHGDLEAAKARFEQYLPYAIVFGIERSFIQKFAAVDTPAPSWWGPVFVPGHGHGYGYPHTGGMPAGGGVSGGGLPGPLAGEGGGMPTLTGMSEGLGQSLAGMSDSLGSMLSSASNTLASTPAPKSSSGGGWSGGGWSGGGFSGGGGGGGGSRGFG